MGIISRYNKELNAEKLQCTLCSKYCILQNGEIGQCGVRKNENSSLVALNWGLPLAFCLDPIEKKPLYHYLPGSKVVSIGNLGCNFKCLNCQNFQLSHSNSKITSSDELKRQNLILPQRIVEETLKAESPAIAYTYSEPTIFWDYIADIITEMKSVNPIIKHILVSNGYFSKELLGEIIDKNYIDAMNIDLKFIKDELYRQVCAASLNPIKRNIENIVKDSGIHLELTNLLIPGLNDDADSVKYLCEFVASISQDIPLHFSRFFPMFKLNDRPETPIDKMLQAEEIALDFGIKFVYLGNVVLPTGQNTRCPHCGTIMIERNGYDTKIVAKQNEQNNTLQCVNCKTELKIFLKG